MSSSPFYVCIEYPMEAGQVYSGLWHQSGQPGYKAQWLEDHMGGCAQCEKGIIQKHLIY